LSGRKKDAGCGKMNLYVHVPFCVKKCNYCAFYSVCPAIIDWDDYVDGILRQMDEFDIDNYEIKTLFFGGGTPSLMPVKYAEKIIKKLRIVSDAEWTLEANPKTIGPAELKDWKDFGMNRLSIGMQSFDDDELRFLGRIHTVADSMKLLSAANDLNLCVSGDFIYGLPGQSVADVIKLCEQINDIGLRHASLYELIIERGTPFEKLAPASESIVLEMYSAIRRALKLARYEVSNYGDPCRHNANIWAGGEYIGVGESAAGRFLKNDGWIETKIINGQIVENKLTNRERMIEIIMTGLRTMRGVAITAPIRNTIEWDFILNNRQYFVIDGEYVRMTDDGLLLLDGLMPNVIK
jgi:oxygen-independent coproporphyrinogen-3 oxidase